MSRNQAVDVITMGCSKNLVDSERLLKRLQAYGFDIYHNPKHLHNDIVVINTCGFINDAKEESVNLILELCMAKMKRRVKKVYVMGCLSERFFKELNKEIPQVDKFYGKFDFLQLVDDLIEPHQQPQGALNGRVITTPKHYAYLKISEGCNRQCAFCAIPLITGRHQSRPMEDILEEVDWLMAEGVKEIQVIAQELTYYGMDLYHERRLPELIERIADRGPQWIRLHYAYPQQFPDDLLRVMRERPNVCKYLDIALQHASDNVLERMHRHTTGQYQRELIEKIRTEVPGIALRTTLMVGYPGETEEDFKELMDFTKWARFERMGAFKYSEEEGTPAAQLYDDNVPEEVKDQRLSLLMALQQQISEAHCREKIGTVQRTVIDRREGPYYVGRTEADSPEVDGEVLINVEERRVRMGDFYDVKITDADEFDLYGSIIGRSEPIKTNRT